MARILLCSLLLTAPIHAQDEAPVDETEEFLEGHSHQGEAFNEGPRQAARLMPNNGSVNFAITTSDDLAQRLFNQATGQLHGFWYFEAERSFRQVAAIDPECAMAYWGMAMANVEHEERAAEFAREAWLRRDQGSDRERRYIDMLALFYDVDYPVPEEGDKEHKRKPAEDKKRRGRLVKDYERIIREYPDDIEAKALLVNQLWLNVRSIPISSRQANQALLDDIFAVQPMHPAHHYRIHLWDAKDTAEYALDSALKAGPSWPTVAHQWHMGGHLFAQLGRHSDAAWRQEASTRVDHAHMMRDRVLPDQIHNFAHNNEWLVRSMRHSGRVRDAISLARNMVELPRHPEWNVLDEYGGSASFGRRRLFETLELFELWEELVALCDTMYLEPSDKAGDESLRAFLLGKAHAFLGNDEALEREIERLQELVEREKEARVESVDAAEAKALEEDLSASKMREAMTEALKEHESTLKGLRSKIESLEALTEVLAGYEVEEALERLEKLRFDKSHLARMHADAELFEEAEKIARKGFENKVGQAYPYATLAYVLDRAGKRDEALEVFRELRGWSARFDLDVPVFQRLAPLAEAEGLPADWRVPYAIPDDIGELPDLDTLGPFRWTPPLAPAWRAPGADGVELALADYEGRPHVMILFLGFGCVHCVEQLLAFQPLTDEFRAAGIDIVTIGTDTVAQIVESEKDLDEEDRYPFPILSDPELANFHMYRAYDDFEELPLHGTFLIDGRGRMRWMDVSFEPFTDPEFLLAESKRLLGLPQPGGDAVRPTTASTSGGPGGGATEGR